MNFRLPASGAVPDLRAMGAGAGVGAFAVRPAWGLLGVAAGTLAAVVLVPASGYYLHGALVPAGLALSAGLLLGPVICGVRNPLTALRAEHLLAAGLVYWILLDALQSMARLWDVSQATVQLAFLCTGLFAAFLWVGSALASLLFVPGMAARAPPDVGPSFLFGAGLGCFAFGFAQSTFTCEFDLDCLVNALSAPRFEVPWFTGPGLKGFNTLLMHLKYFGYLTLPILVALYVVERRVSWRVAALAPLTLAFLVLLIRDGGRKELGTVIGAALLVWILLQPRLRPRHYAMLLAAAAGLLMLMQTMLTWREVGMTRALEGDQAAPKAYTGLAVDWSLEWMTHVMQVVPERVPHTGWTGIVYVVGYPIPRSVWPTKPVLRGIDLPTYIGREYGPGFSWNCTVVGDLYLIGGVLAVCIGGLFYGVAANFASRLLFRAASVHSRLMYAVIAMTLFLSLRALWELTAQGVTVAAMWLLLMTHLMAWRPWQSAAR